MTDSRFKQNVKPQGLNVKPQVGLTYTLWVLVVGNLVIWVLIGISYYLGWLEKAVYQ